jgi:hypothetical protein
MEMEAIKNISFGQINQVVRKYSCRVKSDVRVVTTKDP